ncbi:hypothetical protein N7452_010125 [Penicillium brevicompactum]|uniref:Uncharacterized protein n=1 Tax=Penicillium brevicompactum TaxID=5074 RepID=A0A9W9UD06_PENBR|nr:hypothetical protein N7452_010125 [Penicillium brevicompactum]
MGSPVFISSAKKDKKRMKVPKNRPTTFITAAAQRPHSDQIWLQYATSIEDWEPPMTSDNVEKTMKQIGAALMAAAAPEGKRSFSLFSHFPFTVFSALQPVCPHFTADMERLDTYESVDLNDKTAQILRGFFGHLPADGRFPPPSRITPHQQAAT